MNLKKNKAAANPAVQNVQKNPKPNRNNNNNQNNQNNQNKKGWVGAIFTKLSKRYEEFHTKPPE